MALFSHTYSYVKKGDGTAPINRITLQNLFYLISCFTSKAANFLRTYFKFLQEFFFQYLSNTLDCDIAK